MARIPPLVEGDVSHRRRLQLPVGYSLGIAPLAAGVLAPVATIMFVLLTLATALPICRRVANGNPDEKNFRESLLTKREERKVSHIQLGTEVVLLKIVVNDASEHSRQCGGPANSSVLTACKGL